MALLDISSPFREAVVPISRTITLRVDRVKVGEAMGGSFKVDTGTERVVTFDAIAYPTGSTLCDVSWKTVIPQSGMRAKLMGAILSKKDVAVQFVMEGNAYSIVGRIVGCSVDWENSSGKLEGDWTMLGGEPTVGKV